MASNPVLTLPQQLTALTVLALAFTLSHLASLERYIQQRYHWVISAPPSEDAPLTGAEAFAPVQTLKAQAYERSLLASQALFGPTQKAPPAAAIPQPPAPSCPTAPSLAQPLAAAPLDTNQAEAPPAAQAPQTSPPVPFSQGSGKKVLLAGDSMMQGVAPHLQVALRKRLQIASTDLSKQSTGLLYTGGFNWPQTLETAFATGEYQTLVILLGANDTWDLQQKTKSLPFGSDDWKAAYGSRVRSILESAQNHQVKVVWLAAPPMGRNPLDKRISTLNQAIAEQVAQFPQQAEFIATAPSLTQDGANFTQFLTLPQQGDVRIRTQDGVHFTPQGQKILAQLTLNHLQPAVPAEVNHAP